MDMTIVLNGQWQILLGVVSLIYSDSFVLLHLPCALIFSISSSSAFIRS